MAVFTDGLLGALHVGKMQHMYGHCTSKRKAGAQQVLVPILERPILERPFLTRPILERPILDATSPRTTNPRKDQS